MTFLAIVCKTVCPMLSVHCLSVTLVYCGQTVGLIKMKLGTEVGLIPGHIVLDGELAPPKKGHSPLPIFGPCLLWPNGWIDQDATSYEGRRQPRRHCVRWGTSSPSPERGQSPQFSAHVYCAQTVGWIKMPLGRKVCLDPSDIVLDGNPASPPRKKWTQRRPKFSAHVNCCLLYTSPSPRD